MGKNARVGSAAAWSAIALFVSVTSWAGDCLKDFQQPPHFAKTGVWWHWMGSAVSHEGIVKDLDWFRDMGVGTAVIFAMPDSISGRSTIPGGPTDLIAATPDWWRMVRFAVEEATKRGIEIGLHNCPGYSHTGGKWTTPQHAMRDLVFECEGKFVGEGGKPFKNRLTDRQDLETCDCAGRKVTVFHVAKDSYCGPTQFQAAGYECDKMSAAAVNAHWDHVLANVRQYLGEYVGHGFNFLHIDSYEAKRPTWTPKMREEFRTRRGYDPLPYLPLLGGFKVDNLAKPAKTFIADFNRTMAELYRDNIFKITKARLNAVGLEFCCEPYSGPFDRRECGAYLDRIQTEFWLRFPGQKVHELPEPGKWFKECDRYLQQDLSKLYRADGSRFNVVEAECFDGWATASKWIETPARCKLKGDRRWTTGINRFVLHSVALQAFGDGIKPGQSFGPWGSHFGRNQTWAKDAKAWFDYMNRSQALLQWGEPADELRWNRGDFGECVRKDGSTVVRFLVNGGHTNLALTVDGEWFDPVDGSVGPIPQWLEPGRSGFLVTGRPGAAKYAPQPLPARIAAVEGEWTVDWRSAAPNVTVAPLKTRQFFEWTTHSNAEIRYFSGTARYSTSFDCAQPKAIGYLALGGVREHSARVILNGCELGVVWCSPYRVKVPPMLLKPTGNRLEIDYTNVWANRLIGDEQYPPIAEWRRDCTMLKDIIGDQPVRYPEFIKTGRLPPDTQRHTFVMWNYFKPDSPLEPSGLLGPVELLSR